MGPVNQVRLGAKFIADRAHRKSHDRCLWDARVRRDQIARQYDGWEQLRQKASDIRTRVLDNLDRYVDEFERNASKAGIIVHRAATAKEHNEIMADILYNHNVSVVTKGKSMLQDECGMREYLEERGFSIYEADLGERIQQLDNQRASHIVMPAIHKLRSDVARIFADKLGSDPNCDDPRYLNSVMRKDMRRQYGRIDAGMTGVNFAIASTGGIVVCTNEGNADISATMPPLYIASMGMEKIIPSPEELPVFIELLSRSALGFPITQYTTHFHGPLPGQEMHIIIVDNGRRARLADPLERHVLKCIRCGACMNTCPVFRRTSGLSYDAPYMGPVGTVLMPSYDLHRYSRLPYSCTHCGSCGNVCPVKVPIPEMILRWRDRIVGEKEDEFIHRMEMNAAEMILGCAERFTSAEAVALWGLRHIPHGLLDSPLNPWAADHITPTGPRETFRKYASSEAAKNVMPFNGIKTLPKESRVEEEDRHDPKCPRIPLGKEEMIEKLDAAMKSVDGKLKRFATRSEAIAWLKDDIEDRPEADKSSDVCSAVADYESTGVFAGKKASDYALPPHRWLAGERYSFIANGDIAVAETGSVWLTDKLLGSPSCALMSTDLYLLVPSSRLVERIPDAYAKIDITATPYGAFYTGPSATADIEAVHVTGAQAELSLTLLLYDE